MKYFIKSILRFLPFSVIVYLILIIIWGNWVPLSLNKNIKYIRGSHGHLYSRIQDLNNYKDVDILFLGSSMAYRGFDVRLFEKEGLNVFNLGSSQQSPIQTELLLKRYLDDLNPKTIIYAIAPNIFEIDGVESSIDLIANDKNDILSIEMAISIKNIKTFNTLIYGFSHDILNRSKEFFKEDIIKNDDVYISGGYVQKELKYYSPFKDKTNTAKNYTMNPPVDYQLKSFNNLVEHIHSKNIKLIFVYPPITQKHYMTDIDLKKITQNKGDYYNFNTLLELDDSLYFSDSFHLNQKGVEVFNKKIIELFDL